MIVHALLLLLLLGLAVARASQLIVDDQITFPIRRFVVRKFGEDHPVTTLVHCIACVSVWVSFFATLYCWLFLNLHLALTLPLWFALSYAAMALTKLTR